MADSSSIPVNFFGGSYLNRLSWLRSSHAFLDAIIVSPTTRWVLFKDGNPLIASSAPALTDFIPSPDSDALKGPRTRYLARLSTAEVRPLLGSEPYFSQGQVEGTRANSDSPILEAARIRGAPIVFLGLHQDAGSEEALPSSDFSAKADASEVAARIKGTPYFSLDVSDFEDDALDPVLRESELGKAGAKLVFTEARAAMGSYDYFDAAVVASARGLVDWNARNQFCPACGSPVYSLWAGWKLSCSSLLPWADNAGRKPCPSGKGLQNFAHPRTDAVVIVIVVNEANDRVLLGRSRKWPGMFYSALAGFIEPGESLEDAVKRELWEEAGVKVWGVQYHSTQPWPFPANLMVGFYAIADPAIPTRTDLDNELADARWYTREEILAVLAHPEGTKLGARNPEKPFPKEEASTASALTGDAAAKVNSVQIPTSRAKGPPFRVPPLTAIAGVLLSDWAYGKVVIGETRQITIKKGNL